MPLILNPIAWSRLDPQRLRKAIRRRIMLGPPRLGKIEERPLQIGHIPVRFSLNYEKYRTIGKAFPEKSAAAFIAGNAENNAGARPFLFLGDGV